MAANILDKADYNRIIQRVKQLDTSNTALWGRMNLAQMLEHCSMQLKLALGEVPQTHSEGPRFYRTNIGRWLILYLLPWPKGTATPTPMNMLENNMVSDEVEPAKQNLMVLLERVRSQQQLTPHPFFGAMNKQQWGRLVWKHLDHHLKQFGV